MGKRIRYTNVHITLTVTPPPTKTWKTPSYRLERYTIRRHVHVVSVQIHGVRGNERRTESISFPLLPGVTDTEFVRAAVWFSPNKWTVPFGMNFKQFSGGFASPINEQLQAALMGSSRASSPGASQRTASPLYAAPTVANVPVSPSSYQSLLPQPGQFHQAFTPVSPAGSRPGIRQWYTSRSKRAKIGLWAALIAFVIFISVIGNALGSTNPSATSTPSPTTRQAIVIAATPTTQTAKPTIPPTPKPKPTITIAPKPTVKPTPRSTQPPATPTPCPGINCNPWGYNFSSGNLIYNPPSNFCAYFNCIPSFWQSTNGYVDECADDTYSHSGGVQGACSHHGGEMRPLYSH